MNLQYAWRSGERLLANGKKRVGWKEERLELDNVGAVVFLAVPAANTFVTTEQTDAAQAEHPKKVTQVKAGRSARRRHM